MFDPDRVAELEIDMWQAYYAHEKVRLFKDLVVSLHEQNRYPRAKAGVAAFHLARAAATFADLRAVYGQVLPDLERAYTIARDWNGARFDPAAVARAELAWWVARRQPGQNSPEQVGGLIADENALLYETSRDRVLAASILRARAGRLRDEGGEQAELDRRIAAPAPVVSRAARGVGGGALKRSTPRPSRVSVIDVDTAETYTGHADLHRDEALHETRAGVRE